MSERVMDKNLIADIIRYGVAEEVEEYNGAVRQVIEYKDDTYAVLYDEWPDDDMTASERFGWAEIHVMAVYRLEDE